MDPLWAQVGITAVLVSVTIYYAYQVRKSNKNVWKLEEKRVKNKKIGLRKVILQEIYSNDLILNRTKKWIENRLKDLEKPRGDRREYKTQVPKFESAIKEFPETTLYENTANGLGILGKEEIKAIIHVYKQFKEIRRETKEYPKKFNDPEKSNEDIIKALEPINESIAHTSNFVKNMKKAYNRLFEGKIDEEELERVLSNL